MSEVPLQETELASACGRDWSGYGARGIDQVTGPRGLEARNLREALQGYLPHKKSPTLLGPP